MLVGHGSPPKEISYDKLSKYLRLEKMAEEGDKEAEALLIQLDKEIRSYPRTPENDPYFYAHLELVDELKKNPIFTEVIPAFNEFCDPSVEEAIERVSSLNPELVLVVPTMVTRGGKHVEDDIPSKIKRITERLRNTKVVYAWPFEKALLIDFLSRHIERFIDSEVKEKP